MRNPISSEDVPAMDNIAAREGMEQRTVPTGMGTRDNETERYRNFSESIFREWLPADSHPHARSISSSALIPNNR